VTDERVPVSVVIATYNRPSGCRAAVASVLAQRRLPLEVLVCDDASPRDAVDELRAWCEPQPGVEFLGLGENRGPAAARNAGIERARGEWIAFLDDDDRWLPETLAAQWVQAESGSWDVIAGNGVRPDGSPFYSEPPPRQPTFADIHAANPVILSTALARRSTVLAAGGFREGRKYLGIEDYALWLAMADIGARFLVLPDALVAYEDADPARLSSALITRQVALARLSVARWLRAPLQAPRAKAAARESIKASRFIVGRAIGR
jgi:glycosyltransferase involved in cell wall biosynthesis